MDTVTPIPDRKSIEAEACAWIAQLDGAEPSQEDLAALREWMNRSPAHQQAISDLSALWDGLNVLTELAVPRPSRERRSGGNARLGHSVVPLAALAAACVVVVVGFFASEWREVGRGTPPAGVPAPVVNRFHSGTFDTAIGGQRTIALADGSLVTLNTNTKVEVELDAGARNVRLLKGEALFEVQEDLRRPFRVRAGNGVVRAVGTAFTVYLKERDRVSVTVADGEVELATVQLSTPEEEESGAAESVTLVEPLALVRAGQVATFGAGVESIRTLDRKELSRQLSWRDGMLHFDGESLSQVIDELSRYTTQKIVILDPGLRDLRIGGYFKVGETEAMFEALETSFGVRVERIGDDQVYLSKQR